MAVHTHPKLTYEDELISPLLEAFRLPLTTLFE